MRVAASGSRGVCRALTVALIFALIYAAEAVSDHSERAETGASAQQVNTGQCCQYIKDASKKTQCEAMSVQNMDQVKKANESCYGGVGPGCEGVPAWAPTTKNADGTYTMFMSTGSIYHDTCCVVAPYGHTCSGATADPFTNWADTCACQLEWSKARLNSGSSPSRTWKVNLKKTSNMNDVVRNETLKPWIPALNRQWLKLGNGSLVTREVMENLAPGCTPLDCPADTPNCKVGFYPDGIVAGDSMFCASGKFITIQEPKGLKNEALKVVQNVVGSAESPRFGRCFPHAPGSTKAIPVEDCAAIIEKKRKKYGPKDAAAPSAAAAAAPNALSPA